MLLYVVGIGDFMSEDMVCLLMFLKINLLVCGYFGICLSVVEVLIKLYNVEVYLVIFEKGFVGVSGDLVLFVYMSVVLFGEGEVFYCGECIEVK